MNFVRLPEFLGVARGFLLDYVRDHEADFRAATVAQAGGYQVNQAVRRARILDSIGEYEEPFVKHLRIFLPDVIATLALPPFEVARIEVQATASNDGDFFRLHIDGGPDSTRVLSYVYYLHDEPHPFTGGELRISHISVVDGMMVPGESIIQPEGDTIVFFPSGQAHEVLPLAVPSGNFADGRFTVNGWIHRHR